MKRVPGSVHCMAVERCSRIFPLAHDFPVERLDRHALGAEVGAPVWLTEGCDGGELFPQRHAHPPRRRVLDQALERPKSAAGHDLHADGAELVPLREPAMCFQYVSQKLTHGLPTWSYVVAVSSAVATIISSCLIARRVGRFATFARVSSCARRLSLPL